MTRDAAVAYAVACSQRFGKVYVVYRFPAWPADVYSVVTRDRLLPPEAETVEFKPPTQAGQQGLFE